MAIFIFWWEFHRCMHMPELTLLQFKHMYYYVPLNFTKKAFAPENKTKIANNL